MKKTSDRIELPGGFHLTMIDHPDVDSIVKHMNDPEIAANTLTLPYPYTVKDAKSWINSILDWEMQHELQKDWAIREPQGTVIGAIGLLYDFGIHSHRSSIGYWLGRSYWGRGLMTSAIDGLCEYIFENRPIVRLEAAVFEWNLASARCLEKAGFRYEAFQRKTYVKDGRAIGANLWSRIAGD